MNDISPPDGFWELPSCPRIVDQVLSLIPLDEESISDLWDVVRWDPALAVRILAAAGASRWDEAKSKLDGSALAMLSLQFTLPKLESESETTRLSYETFWRRSQIAAITLPLVWNEKLQPAEADADLFLAGLLRDYYRLILMHENPAKFREVFETVLYKARPWADAEREVCGTQLRNVSEKFLKASNLPPTVPFIENVLNVAAAVSDFMILGDLNPKKTYIWKELLKQEYAVIFGEVPDVEQRLLALMQLVQQTLQESLPAAPNVFKNTARLALANRELARLGLDAHSRAGKPRSREKKSSGESTAWNGR